jgi:hypothetical protein
MQQLFYQHLYVQPQTQFISFINEESTFFETNPIQKDIEWQIFILATNHKSSLNLMYPRLRIDKSFQSVLKTFFRF